MRKLVPAMVKTLSCALLLSSTSFAQSQLVSVKGNYHWDGSAPLSELRGNVESHVLTTLTLEMPDGRKSFNVRTASHVAHQGDNAVFYEGTVAGNDSQRVLLQIYADHLMVKYHDLTNGNQYTLARESDITDAAFWGYLRNGSMEGNVTAKTSVADMDASLKARFLHRVGNAGYAWVKEAEVNDVLAAIEASKGEQVRPGCPEAVPAPIRPAAASMPLKNELAKQTSSYYFPLWNSVGYIGKWDLFLYLYNYANEVSTYDMDQMDNVIPNSLYDSYSGFNNIRVVIRRNPVSITSTVLPWNSNSVGFLESFSSIVQSKSWLIYPNTSREYYLANNTYHMLLNRNKLFDYGTVGGRAYLGGNFGIANVWFFPSFGFSPTPHEFGHMLNANHVNYCPYGAWGGYWTWWNDLMQGNGGLCLQLMKHVVSSNITAIGNQVPTVSILDESSAKATASISAAGPGLTLYTFNCDTRSEEITWGLSASKVAGELFDGQQLNGSTYGEKLNVYRVNIKSAGYFTFIIDAADYDTYLYLLDNNGKLVASDDDGAGGFRSRIQSYLTSNNYYVIVGGFMNKSGTATLKIKSGSVTSRTTGTDTALNMGNGNIVYSADFGITDKKAQAAPVVSDNDMYVYPNPLSLNGSFTVRFNTASGRQYTLYNLMGRAVMSGELQSASAEICMKGLPVGNYLIKVDDKTNAKSFTRQITVQ